jgi:hypothetical protein
MDVKIRINSEPGAREAGFWMETFLEGLRMTKSVPQAADAADNALEVFRTRLIS